MENTNQNCQDLPLSGSDNEKTSSYSSKDGSSNYDATVPGTIKTEYQHLSEHFPLMTQKIEENDSNFKIEKTMPTLSSSATEVFVNKKRQTFKCSYCPKVFSNSSAIAKHKLTHSDERKYVCDTCGKAFKRQDHLNGHKHTHKTNKPHACHLCDRSYSDARSLRRHYENQHQNEFLRCKEQKIDRESAGSSVDESISVDIFGILDESKCIKCDVCGKGFKNQSALNGHMRLHGGYGQTNNSITGPGEVKPVMSLILDSSQKVESTSKLVWPSSSKLSNIVVITTVPTEMSHSKLHSLLTAKSLSQNIKNCSSLAPKNLLQSFERCLPAISSSVVETSTLPNINMDELCLCLSPSSSVNVNPSSSTLVETANPSSLSSNTSRTITNTTKSIIQHSSLNSQYSPITPAFPSETNSTNISNSHMFNYPTLFDNHFETPNREEFHYTWDNTQAPYISTGTNTNQKHWSCYDLSINMPDLTDNKSSNPSSLPPISSSNNLQDLIMNLESIDTNDTNLDAEGCNISDGNDDVANIAESSETESLIKKELIDRVIVNNSYNCSQPNANENPSNSPYKQTIIQESSMTVPYKKNKTRPAPIFIPPQTSAHMSRLRSPRVWNTSEGKEIKIPPYTPPPMLSPQRKGSGLFNSVWQCNNRTSGNLSCGIYPWNTSLSTGTITAMSNSHCTNSVVLSSSLGSHQISSVLTSSPVKEKLQFEQQWANHFKNPSPIIRKNCEPEHFLYQDECIECQPQSVEDSDGLPTSATPRINIGPQYQAELPKYCNDKRRLREEKRVWDVLLWDPKQFKDTVENISSLDLLMKIASSPAVKSCGLNMEYTFHLLCKYKGDLEKTLQVLLEDSFVVYDYVYAETTTWTTEEINKFQERLKKHDRDFMRVAFDLQSYGMNKSVKACVEFYYVWKQMNNVKDINRYRIKSSRKKLITLNNNSFHDDEICPPNNDTISSVQVAVDSGYNLRKKFPSGSQRTHPPYSSYEYRSSSGGSSREASPLLYKPLRNMLPNNGERAKRPYQCSQCKRKFSKSKALENHLKTHKSSTLIRDKLLLR